MVLHTEGVRLGGTIYDFLQDKYIECMHCINNFARHSMFKTKFNFVPRSTKDGYRLNKAIVGFVTNFFIVNCCENNAKTTFIYLIGPFSWYA